MLKKTGGKKSKIYYVKHIPQQTSLKMQKTFICWSRRILNTITTSIMLLLLLFSLSVENAHPWIHFLLLLSKWCVDCSVCTLHIRGKESLPTRTQHFTLNSKFNLYPSIKGCPKPSPILLFLTLPAQKVAASLLLPYT